MTSIPPAIWRIYRNNLNAIISEAKDLFWIFYFISEMCMKFRAFSKKNEYPSLIVSEIIDAENMVT